MRTRQVLTAVIVVVIAVIIIAVGFTFRQATEERLSLSADLQYRTRLLADGLKESIEPYYIGNSTAALQKIVDKFANRERLVGLEVYDSKAVKIAASAELAKSVLDASQVVSKAMDSDKPLGDFLKTDGKNIYVLALPLHEDDRVIGAFLIFQNASYIDATVRQIWQSNLLKLLIQIPLFLLLIALFIRWVIVKPLMNLVESVRSARTAGQTNPNLHRIKDHAFFKPLVGEIAKMTKSLSDARSSASEEARMRLEKLDTPWTAERLKEFIKAYLKNRPIFVVSNREPYIHQKVKNEIIWSVVPSGMGTAVNSVMEACGGMWMAYGSGNADRETADESGKIAVPPDDPKYTLKRIWLTEKETEGHYGFSVEAMYPLCLMTYNPPSFKKEDWMMYRRVNGKFAQALLAELKDIERPIVLVQDYHFAILPQMIKAGRPDAQIAIFWHVPWPSAEAFSVCPWRKEILEGMLGADIVGFNTQQFCNNFMDTVGKEIESLVDLERFSITREEHTTYVKPFPISIAFTNGVENQIAASVPGGLEQKILQKLGIKTKYLGLGVDRLDYAKGIPERFKGIEHFLDTHPEYKGQFTFLQIASPHREYIEKYREYQQLVTQEAERINNKFAMKDWRPIILEKIQYTHSQLSTLFKVADLCLITSLHDSMNLVAKEYVAARDDLGGALILSQFAGASRDLKGAIIINPHSTEEIAEAIYTALTMPATEQHRRMKVMRDRVKDYNVYRWAAELIKAVASLG